MHSKISILFPLLALTLNANAENISEATAKELAAEFLSHNSKGTMKRAASDGGTLTLAKKSAGYYIFNRPNSHGFIVVASDDQAAEPILGYADNGTLDGDDMPDNMKGWLAEYDRQIDFMEAHPATQTASRATESERTAIAPIVKSLWTQEAPFNTLCPKSGKQTCYVGCTATALAMVMRHHRWPERGQGSYSYNWLIGSNFTTVSADFSQSTYNWDIMEDRYAVDDTGESADAVALLSYNVGVASHMQYGTSGSGAYLYDAGAGLLKYFDYDKSLRFVSRDYYSHDEWQDLIYGELASNRPVVYSGYTSNWYGHTFIIDGYDNGYYHFNWGWAGQYNGYFRLSALYPYGYGSNGKNYQYNYRQEALIGIQKNIGTAYANPEIVGSNFFTSNDAATFNDKVEFDGSLTYRGLYDRVLRLGIEITSTTGQKTYILGDAETMRTNDRLNISELSLTSFPSEAGSYVIRPVAYDPEANEYYSVKIGNSSGTNLGYVTATVEGNNITFSSPERTADPKLSFSNLTLPTTIYAGMDFLASATFSATGGDYYGDASLAFYPAGSNTPSAKTNPSVIDVTEGGSYEANLIGKAPAPGTYTLRMLDSRSNPIGTDTTIVVGDSITSKLAMKALGLTMASTTDVDPNNIEMEFNIACTGGTYCDNLFVHFYEVDGTAEYLSLNTDIVSLVKDDELTLEIKGTVDGMKPSTTYNAYILYNSGTWAYILPFNQSSITFTTAASTGIASVEANAASGDILIYSLSGELIGRQHGATPALESLPKGIYVVKTKNGTKKIVR